MALRSNQIQQQMNGYNNTTIPTSHRSADNGNTNKFGERDKENNSANISSNTSSRTASSMSNYSSNKQQQPFKRDPLPIDRYRRQIKEVLEPLTGTALFIGETACGKSTQIPQLCLQFPWAQEGLIAITEPRRVAARTLAMRVAEEQKSAVGDGLVGYKFRFENNTTENNRLVYMTEGILVREMLHNCYLREYAAVIVDEVHERTLNTDVLLYTLRLAQKDRAEAGKPPLRIILMSATLDARQLSDYFDKATVYYLQGRKHPVRLGYAPALKLDDNDYLFNAISAVLELHETEPIKSGFLVFLTGQEEIDTAIKAMKRAKKANPPESEVIDTIVPIALYAAVPTAVQARAFEPPPTGKRKVVFATNIAETSLTIPGIDVVIDSGKVKRRSFTARNRMDVLRVENIAKSQAIQRAGRAGREGPGKCYRLYSDQDYEKLLPEPVPDLQRCNIASTLLSLIELGMRKVSSLNKLMSPPDPDQLRVALHELFALRAIALDNEDKLEITAEGKKLIAFPIEPTHAKILLAASEFGCLEEACIVVAFLAADPVFQFVGHDLLCLNEKHCFGQEESGGTQSGGAQFKFRTNDGDHVRYVNIYHACTSLRRTPDKFRDFCITNSLNQKRLEQVWQIRKQLQDECQKQHLHFGGISKNNHDALKRAICHGLFMNACFWNSSAQCYVMERDRQVHVRIHPSSGLHNQRPSAFVYTELVQTNEVYARDICPVQEEWVRELNSKNSGIVELDQRIRQLLTASTTTTTPNSSAEKQRKKKKIVMKKKKRKMMKRDEEEEKKKRKKRKEEEKAKSVPKLVEYSPSGSSNSSGSSSQQEEEEVEEDEQEEEKEEQDEEEKKEEGEVEEEKEEEGDHRMKKRRKEEEND